MTEKLPAIVKKLSMCAIHDVWNVDEFGLFYKLSPASTIRPERIPGRKKVKDRQTFLACLNGDGTEKFPVMIIGNLVSLSVLEAYLEKNMALITIQTKKTG